MLAAFTVLLLVTTFAVIAFLAVFTAFATRFASILTLLAFVALISLLAFVSFFAFLTLIAFVSFIALLLLLLLFLFLFLLFLELVEAFLDEVAIINQGLVVRNEFDGRVEVADRVGPGLDGEAGFLGKGAVALVIEGVAETLVSGFLNDGVSALKGLTEGTDGGVELL